MALWDADKTLKLVRLDVPNTAPVEVQSPYDVRVFCSATDYFVGLDIQGKVVAIDHDGNVRLLCRIDDGFFPWSAASSNDGNRFGFIAIRDPCSDTEESCAYIWTAHSEKPLLKQRFVGVQGIAFRGLHDEAVVFGSDSSVVHHIDFGAGATDLRSTYLSLDGITSFDFSSNGDEFAYSNSAGRIEIRNCESRTETGRELTTANRYSISRIKFSRDDRRLLALGSSNSDAFERPEKDAEWRLTRLPAGMVEGVFVDDDRIFFSTSYRVGQFDLVRGHELGDLNFGYITKVQCTGPRSIFVLRHRDSLLHVDPMTESVRVFAESCECFAADGNEDVLVTVDRGTLTIARTNGEICARIEMPHRHRVSECRIDGSLVVIVAYDRESGTDVVSIVDHARPNAWMSFAGHSGLAPSKLDQILIARSDVGDDGGELWQLTCYKRATRKKQWETTFPNRVNCMGLLDGVNLLVATQDGIVWRVPVATGKPTRLFEAGDNIHSMAISPNGNRIMLGMEKKVIEVDSAGTPTGRVLRGPRRLVTAGDFLDASQFVGGGEEGCLYIWAL